MIQQNNIQFDNDIIIPFIFKDQENIVAAQSTRNGGVSPYPYASMNLGSNTADEICNIEQNKILFTQALRVNADQVVRAKQVHGTSILIAEKGGYFEGYDAMITDKSNLLLVVSTADCVPILLYDTQNKAVAAIHAGWKGTKDRLVSLTIEKLSQMYKSEACNILAYIGPCIDECSYEVDVDVAQYFEEAHCRFDNTKNKFYVDLKGHNMNQLLDKGLPMQNIEVSAYDTFMHTDLFFSHRREGGITGRMWTVIGIR